MIRILNIMCWGLGLGGAEQAVMNYYRNMDRSKIQFDFLISETKQGGYFEAEALALGAKIYLFSKLKGRPGVTKQKSFVWFIRFFREHPEYKIVHIHCDKPAAYVEAILLALSNVPARIIHSHNSFIHTHNWHEINAKKQFLLRLFATHWFACSKEAGISLFGQKAVEGRRFKVIPNAQELELYRYNPKIRDETRRRLNLENNFILINVGALKEQKNQSFLLEVVAVAKSKIPNIVLLVAGEGKLRGELEYKIAQLELETSVKLLGARSDVEQLYQASDLFVFPSLHEGFGNVVIEAQAAGLPCLVSHTVPREIEVTDNVEYLPIDNGPEVWVERAYAHAYAYSDYKRKDTIDDIRTAGYDIKGAAKKLEKFYLETYASLEKRKTDK